MFVTTNCIAAQLEHHRFLIGHSSIRPVDFCIGVSYGSEYVGVLTEDVSAGGQFEVECVI
jgi:hypothetical protein